MKKEEKLDETVASKATHLLTHENCKWKKCHVFNFKIFYIYLFQQQVSVVQR